MSKTKKKDIDRELREIYADESGKVPYLRRFEKARESKIRKALVALVIFFAALAATSWAGFFVFGRQFRGEAVTLDILGPDEVTSGDEIEIKLRYRNRDRNPLSRAALNVTIPKEFKVTDLSPPTAEGGKWELGTVGAGASDEIKIKGKVFSRVGSALTIQALLVYRPANFNAEFEKVAAKSIQVSDFIINGSILGPDKILAGEPAIYKIRIFNDKEAAQANVAARFVFPNSFILSSGPKDLTLDRTLTIKMLGAGEDKEYEIAGAFSSGVTETQEIKVELGFFDDEKKLRVGRELTFGSEVLASDLDLAVSVNDKTDSAFANFGDTLNLSIHYKNKGAEDLKNVELSLNLAGLPAEGGQTPVNFSTLDASGGKREGNKITWTKKQIAALANLRPESEGEILTRVLLVSKPFTTTSRDYKTDINAEAKIGTIGDVRAERVVQSKIVTVKILSDAGLAAEGRYYTTDGIVLGTGPLPPRVGETTSYRVFWKISNTLHEIENLEVSAALARGVAFSGRTNIGAGDLRYDSASRKVSWTLNRMPLSVAHLESNFEVSITPGESDRGKILELTGPTTLTARDKFNEGIITLTDPEPITTAMPNDEFGKGKGKVQ